MSEPTQAGPAAAQPPAPASFTDPASASAAEPLIAELAALGPFFAALTHPDDAPPREPWRSMGELAHDPAVLGERIAAVRGFLAAGGGQRPDAVEERVAASVAHLGLVARLVSPALALAVLGGAAPTGVSLARLRWQPTLGGPWPLSLPHSAVTIGADADPERLAAALARHVLDGPVRELADAVAPWRVSPHILWGNTASALNGAATMLAAARPSSAAQVRAVAALLLDRPPLAGTSTTAAPPGRAFRRRSCCLIYRAAPDRAGALCGDCALDRPE